MALGVRILYWFISEEDHHEHQADHGEEFGTTEVEECGGQHEDSDGDHVLVERKDIEIGSVLCKLGDISVIGDADVIRIEANRDTQAE